MDEAHVLSALRILNLKIKEEELPGVTAQLRRIAAIASTLEEVELDPFTDEIAPVWRP